MARTDEQSLFAGPSIERAPQLNRTVAAPITRKVLNVGSGPYEPGKLHSAFKDGAWAEIRLDIDPSVAPDIVGSITNLEHIPNQTFDAIWCSHAVEHLRTHQVVPSLRELKRVLKRDGFALITCPDLESVAQFIMQSGLDHVVYESGMGPITPLDILFGHSRSVAEGNAYMAHHTGFTVSTLGKVLLQAEFAQVRVGRAGLDLWAVATMPDAEINFVKECLFRSTEAFLMGETLIFR